MGKMKKCLTCDTLNQLNHTSCIECGSSDFEEDFSEFGESSETSASEQPASEASEQGPSLGRCPICSMELDSNLQCPRHPRSGFRLVWSELGITTRIPDSRPLFVGRVPPVDDDLAQRIERGFPTVSRLHAELSLGQDGHLYLRDMGSRSGTSIDNQPVTVPFERQRVQVGAELSFSSKLHAKVDQA
jgi:hypothetical protein